MNDIFRSPKIKPWHLERRAVDYVRQSTLQQVNDHQESTARQYALADRAVELGWPRERVMVIDDDLGTPISAGGKIINLMAAGIPDSSGISRFRPSDH